MSIFFSFVFSFPTVIFTILLGIALAYWVFVFLGFLDLDIFEVDMDTDVDMDVDADMDADLDTDLDTGTQGVSNGNALANTVAFLGFSGVPITVTYSLVMLWGWLFTYVLAVNVIPLFPGDLLKFIASVVALIVALIISLMVSRICVLPLRPIFQSGNERYRNSDIIGESAEVMTGSVTASFGQAKYCKAGKDLLIEIRCEKENSLSKGSVVVITGYSKEKRTYQVVEYSQPESIEIN